MSRLSDIPVTVEGGAVTAEAGPDTGAVLGGGVVAVLHEVAALLERLHEHGEPGSVDLATMPMAPAEHERLRSTLGTGEVSAEIRSEGLSSVRETAVHGVWWVEHRDPADRTLAEFIEITTVPEILRSHHADIGAGLERLRARLREDPGMAPDAGGDPNG